MGHIWVLYGQKSLYGAHVGLEWDKYPDSAYMGPRYTCLLGYYFLTFTTLWANSADNKLVIVFLFFIETGLIFHAVETICMKCQILFAGKIRENISKCLQ